MITQDPAHRGIHVRNFFTLFVCISIVAYIHYQLGQATNTLQETNDIVNSLLRNQTYSTTQQRLFNLLQSLKSKPYQQLSQSQCIVRTYLSVRSNEQFISVVTQKVETDKKQNNNAVQLAFTELVFPNNLHDLQGFTSCSDIITLITYLNPTKTDLIYTSFVQKKYGPIFKFSQNQQKSKSTVNNNKFCIIVNQFNTANTKLRENINSIIYQSYQDYKLIILDNASSDGSYQIGKVIIQDLKQKLIKQSPTENKYIQQKYTILKEEQKLSLWNLYNKNQALCQGTNYLVFIDGRDSLPTRHTLNILNHQIISSKPLPYFITSPMLKRKQLSRQNNAQFSTLSSVIQSKAIPTYTFKVISHDLYKQTKQILLTQLKEQLITINSTNSEFAVEKITIQALVNYCILNNKSILQVNDILYVYDTIENTQIERNQYYIGIVKKQLSKTKKQNQEQIKKSKQ